MAARPGNAQINPGAVVEASDGRFGTVDEVIVQPQTGEVAYLVVRRGWSNRPVTIPADLIESVAGPNSVRLRVTRDEAQEAATSVPADALVARAEGSEIHIPVLEERLVPAKRPVDLGEVRVHKQVEQVEERVRQPVARDEVVVERVPINQPLEAPVGARTEGDWLIIPVMEEVLVVEKRLMLREEIRIRKSPVTEEQEVRDVVRRERVELEDATVHGVADLPPGSAARAGAAASTSAAPPRV